MAMWGTIARMRLKPDVPEEYLLAQMKAMSTDRMTGWRLTAVYRSDADPHELWMVAMFDSKDAYRRNAESAAQHAIYTMLRSCLEADPEWHDVDEVTSLTAD
jgi:quinol monooxygenase YgiN